MMQLRFPKVFTGKALEHSNINVADGNMIDYKKEIGEIHLRYTNSVLSNGSFLFISIGNDTKNDEFGLCQEISFAGRLEKCSDEAMQYFSRYLAKLDSLRADIKKTVDFLANTMVGNSELSQSVSDFDEVQHDSDLLEEAMDVIVKGDDK